MPNPRIALLVPVTALLAPFPAAHLHAEEPLPQIERLQSSPVLRHLVPNPLPQPPRDPAGQTLARMHVPPGFQVDLVSAEPDVRQPVAMAFDARGRLWIAEAYSYPTKRAEGEGLDQLVILQDADGDGRFEHRKVFAQHLNLVSGFELGHGGVWIGAAPELLFIADRNHDDLPDGRPEVLLDGFGYQDTHECLNSFLWGPDGWLYGIQGVFNHARIGRPGTPDAQRHELRAGVWRYHPTRHEFEIVAHGGSNPWGLDYDERGQLFMTHCRSYWGRGGTTHVIPGGHFWNQANANYAPFIIANPPEEFPEYRNYLLASARYDHGAGGAGEPGSDAIYGGHSHVGTMIYLGDNWPDEFRGRLFTHNLHGHQINQQVNRRWGSGFDTVHAGRDQLFCSDPAYVAIDLQYGPDGAVYFIDWYDQQHCHNPNAERWDRGNGRVYRLRYVETHREVRADLSSLDDRQLLGLLTHKNAWFARTARRLLHERAATGTLQPGTPAELDRRFEREPDPSRRLEFLWTRHAVGPLPESLVRRGLEDPDEYVRGWTIQVSAEDHLVEPTLLARFRYLAATDPSPVVRLYLASAASRLPESAAWDILSALVLHGEDREDRNLPKLLWQALAPRMAVDPNRGFALARATLLPQVADWIHWYAATLEGDPLEKSVQTLAQTHDDLTLRRRLEGLWLAMEPRANVAVPPAWREVAPRLYAHPDARVVRLAERLAAAFGDDARFPRLRELLARSDVSPADRSHAFSVLARAQDRESLPVFLRLLDDERLRSQSIQVLGRFDAPEIPATLIPRLGTLSPQDRFLALHTLTSRATYALALLQAVSSGQVSRDQLTAHHVRQLTALHNTDVDRLVADVWGRILQTPAEKQDQIARLEKTFQEAPLWAYDARAGREHFVKLCASCHVLGRDGTRVGPELTGAGRNGIRYFLENIIDPNAVVGADFQSTLVETRSGDIVTGLVTQETPSALTLRTATEERVIAKTDITERSSSQLSLMPEALLDPLSPREQIELLKFLIEH